MDVTTKDSSGRPIVRPDRALFIYKNHKEPLEYTKFCGYYCVPRGKPLYLMSDARTEGGSLEKAKGGSLEKAKGGSLEKVEAQAKNDVLSFQRPTRYQQTRRKLRDASHR